VVLIDETEVLEEEDVIIATTVLVRLADEERLEEIVGTFVTSEVVVVITGLLVSAEVVGVTALLVVVVAGGVGCARPKSCNINAKSVMMPK
jgi:hypothetical protein